MAGRRKKREKKRVRKGVLLVLFLTVGLTVATPLTPTLDASLASVAAAASPAAPRTETQMPPKAWADFVDGPFGPAAPGSGTEPGTGDEAALEANSGVPSQENARQTLCRSPERTGKALPWRKAILQMRPLWGTPGPRGFSYTAV